MFGISRGAGAAVMAAAESIVPARAILTDGAFSTDKILEWSMKKWVHVFARVRFVYERHRPAFWHFLRWLLLKLARIRFNCQFPSVRKTLHKLKGVSIFLVHGAKDSYITPEHAQMLFDSAKEPRYLWIVPDAKHNQSVSVSPEAYAGRTVEFFEKYLTEKEQSDVVTCDRLVRRLEPETSVETVRESTDSMSRRSKSPVA